MFDKKLLDGEIEAQFEALNDLEFGSDTHSRAIGDLTKLLDKSIEIDKMEHSREESQENAKCEKKDRLFKNIVAVAGLFIPSMIMAGVHIWGTNKSLEVEYEDEKIPTTTAGKENMRWFFKK